jgi:hypothetical protein
MKRLALIIVLLIGIMIIDKVFITTVDPVIQSELTMRQFENPTLETSTALRAYNVTDFKLYAFCTLAMLGLCLYQGEIRRIFKEA